MRPFCSVIQQGLMIPALLRSTFQSLDVVFVELVTLSAEIGSDLGTRDFICFAPRFIRLRGAGLVLLLYAQDDL